MPELPEKRAVRSWLQAFWANPPTTGTAESIMAELLCSAGWFHGLIQRAIRQLRMQLGEVEALRRLLFTAADIVLDPKVGSVGAVLRHRYGSLFGRDWRRRLTRGRPGDLSELLEMIA